MKKLSVYSLLIMACLVGVYASVSAQDLENIAKEKAVTISGGASARMMFYSASGIPQRRKPFSYVLTGSPVVSLYGITIPLYFVYSEQERSFRQPFNQFGMSPRYKWVTVHGGYRNINYSPYTLAGHTMLGGGVDLTPGIFRFGFMYGRLNRATAVDTTAGSFEAYQYNRRGYAAKIGVGKGSNFLDLSMINAKDDSTSVGDVGTNVQRVSPAENVVFGLSGAYTFHNVFVEGDAGLSLYTNNIGSSIAFDSIPDILKNTLGKFININGSTEFYSAYSFAVGYRVKDLSLKVQYKRIDPDFKSMGSYFFNNDLENITISPSFSLFNKKIHIAGSLGLQHDNLQNQKESTSRRVIGSGNVSATLSERLGIDLTYTNFTTRQKPGRVFVADTFLITQTTGNIGIMPRYMVAKENITHTVLLSWNYMSLVDLNASTASNNNLNSTNIFLNYQVILPQKNLTLFINLNSAKLNAATTETGNKGVTLGGNKNMMDNKLTLGLSVSIMQSTTAGKSSLLLNDGLQCTYRVNTHHSFNTNMNYIGSYPGQSQPENPRFSEFRGEVAYMINF